MEDHNGQIVVVRNPPHDVAKECCHVLAIVLVQTMEHSQRVEE